MPPPSSLTAFDGRARVVRTDGTLSVEHAVAPEPVAGKHARQVAATSCTILDPRSHDDAQLVDRWLRRRRSRYAAQVRPG